MKGGDVREARLKKVVKERRSFSYCAGSTLLDIKQHLHADSFLSYLQSLTRCLWVLINSMATAVLTLLRTRNIHRTLTGQNICLHSHPKLCQGPSLVLTFSATSFQWSAVEGLVVRRVFVLVSGVTLDLHDEKSRFSITAEGLHIFRLVAATPLLLIGLRPEDKRSSNSARGGQTQKTHIYCHLFPAFPAQRLPLPVSVWRENVGGGVWGGMLCSVWLRCALITQAEACLWNHSGFAEIHN